MASFSFVHVHAWRLGDELSVEGNARGCSEPRGLMLFKGGLVTDKEIEQLAEQEVNTRWPSEQNRLLSVNKFDWRQGFIQGAKKILEILDLNIKKAGP